eukprot:6457057-Amphidinium_carterae.1
MYLAGGLGQQYSKEGFKGWRQHYQRRISSAAFGVLSSLGIHLIGAERENALHAFAFGAQVVCMEARAGTLRIRTLLP